MAQESSEDLRTRARDEFGIVNADQMTDEQLRSEVKAIEGQPKTAEEAPAEDAAASSDESSSSSTSKKSSTSKASSKSSSKSS